MSWLFGLILLSLIVAGLGLVGNLGEDGGVAGCLVVLVLFIAVLALGMYLYPSAPPRFGH